MSKSNIDHQTLVEKDRALIHSHHFPPNHHDPLIVESAERVWLHTTDGRKILDCMAASLSVNIGYGNKELAEAAYAQMRRMAYTTNLSGTANIPAITLADKLSGYAYPNLRATFFTSGGSEANDTAFKTARYYWQRKGRRDKIKIISRLGGYHGCTVAATSATGMEKAWRMFGPPLPGFVHIPSPNTYRFEGDINEDETIGHAAARALEETITREGPETVAAFIAEPVQGAGGLIVPPDDYFPAVRSICDRYEVLFIADEAVTGFGRTGEMFALNRWGVAPDILTFAKGVTSGYIPLAGIQISDPIHRAIESAPEDEYWAHGFTYSGHATACAVALKNIEIIEREELLLNALRMGEMLRKGLESLLEFSCLDNVRGLGLLCGVEFVKDRATREPDPELAMKVYRGCLERGMRSRPIGNTMAFAPSLIINKEEVDQIIDILGAVLDSMQM